MVSSSEPTEDTNLNIIARMKLSTSLELLYHFNAELRPVDTDEMTYHSFSFRKTWGCGVEKTPKEIAAYNVIRNEHQALGPMTFGELSVLGVFVLLVLLWFTRDPGFMPGWATHLFNSKAEYVEMSYNHANKCPTLHV